MFIGNIQAQDIKIAVIADIHYFDPELIINDGAAFQTYVLMDRKMIRESEAILNSVTDSLISLQPDIVLVPGDLTKDGEYSSHTKVAAKFQEMEDAGIQVVVCPGNHDINSPSAFAYDGADVIPVANVSPFQFDSIYNNFGFGEAIEKDPASLSYLIEPVDGLQILSLDVCKYEGNDTLDHPFTGGEFRPETYIWAKEKIQEAKNAGKNIFAIQHHNMLEHYAGQKSLFSEYVIDNWETASTELTALGLKIVFTGHYHAQDIVRKVTSEGHVIYDIETGSTVTWPSPYHILSLDENNLLTVSGDSIQNIDYDLGGVPFQTYAHNYLQSGLPILVNYMLTQPPYSLDSTMAAQVEPAITESFMAHYHGNEGTPSPQTQATIEMLLGTPYAAIGMILQSMWNDPTPDDWQVSIDLNESYVGTNSQLTIGQIKVFPNPANNFLNILLPGNNQNMDISLLDINGKTIQKQISNLPNTIIDLSNVDAGIYILKIQIADTVLSKKITVK